MNIFSGKISCNNAKQTNVDFSIVVQSTAVAIRKERTLSTSIRAINRQSEPGYVGYIFLYMYPKQWLEDFRVLICVAVSTYVAKDCFHCLVLAAACFRFLLESYQNLSVNKMFNFL